MRSIAEVLGVDKGQVETCQWVANLASAIMSNVTACSLTRHNDSNLFLKFPVDTPVAVMTR